MKKFYLLAVLSLIYVSAGAQTVTISDANFLAYLQFTYPSCVSGNQLNTACAAATSDTSMYISNLDIANIDGIEYFTALKHLNCKGNSLTTLPTLPQSLLTLDCSENDLNVITMLPNSLVELNCNFNELTSIPQLPNTLDILKCYDNQLSALPTFPTLLKVLHCGGNLYNTLPAMPQVLQELNCKGLGLQSLPTLPITLKILGCEYNELTELPTLPNSTEILVAHHNQINALPNLPNSLQELNVGTNNLITLPTLPSGVTFINCEDNAIASLPGFTNQLKYFYCRQNDLSYLPIVPNSMRVLDCSYNPIRCLDFVANWNHSEPAYFYFDNTEVICRPTYSLNLETASLASYMSYPMCWAGNEQGCGLLGMEENAASHINVFPNPTSDFIQIESDQMLGNVEIYDMGGRKVMDMVANEMKVSLDISQLNRGMYVLKLGKTMRKIIKQ